VILFVLLLAGLIYIDNTRDVHWSLYLLLFFVFSGIEFYGACYINSGFHQKAICNVHSSDKLIAMTFDDGPALQTEKILKVLAEFDAKATFFCIGKHIKGKEEILKKIDADGHLIGNHSYSHGFFIDLKNTRSLVNDLELANSEIKKVIGKSPVFFRPPYGVTTPGLARATKKLNFKVIGWNIRSLDTRIKDKQEVLSRIKKRLKPGSILLLHDTIAGTEIVLKELFLYLKEQNYKVVALDQLIHEKAYA